jgi:23S rRNA (pseudouridine1915-N3)-methyltransferase
MKLHVIAVGRLKAGPERALADHYAEAASTFGRGQRLGPVTVAELAESRASSSAARRDEEARKILAAAERADVRVALTEIGRTFDSAAFAAWLAATRDRGTGALAFMIGGADGHGPAALNAADLQLSLGPMTLPHGLARIVLLEQLYRAATILAGHPYHRA